MAWQMGLPGLFLLTACGQASIAEAEPPAEPTPASSRGVIEAVEEQRAMFETAQDSAEEGAFRYRFAGLLHDEIPLKAFAGKAVLVVNTASECGYTPQYADLQETYETFKDEGLVVLGVPSNQFGGQEPGSAEEIESFCRLNYGVTFPMAGKSLVRGAEAHPFYAWAEQELGPAAVPQWNFHKILIGRDGTARATFPSRVRPTSPEMVEAIRTALAEPGPRGGAR